MKLSATQRELDDIVTRTAQAIAFLINNLVILGIKPENISFEREDTLSVGGGLTLYSVNLRCAVAPDVIDLQHGNIQ